MQLSPAQKQYLLREHVIGSGLFNALLNAALVWFTFARIGHVPLWGEPGFAADIVGTGIFLPSLTCAIGTPLIWYLHVRRGKVELLPANALDASLLGKLPRNMWTRAAVLGLGVTLVSAPIVIGAVAASGVHSLSVNGYMIFKALYAGAMAVCVAPVVAITTLAWGYSATATANMNSSSQG